MNTGTSSFWLAVDCKHFVSLLQCKTVRKNAATLKKFQASPEWYTV